MSAAVKGYQWALVLSMVRPYFRYWAPKGGVGGWAMVKFSVEPGVQPITSKANNPWGKIIPSKGGAPVEPTLTSLGFEKVQKGPPPGPISRYSYS